jgi:excisionase family DNA binding protein
MPAPRKNPPAPIAFSAAGAALATQLPHRRILLAVKSRALPAFKIGTRVRILKSDLEQWMRNHDNAC